MSEPRFLDRAYQVTKSGAKSLYDDWAAHYDAELEETGYVTPGRCAEALASVAADKAGPVIDLGCGTGLSGRALRAAGFSTLDGVDLSQAMLAEAKTTRCYRQLWTADLSQPLEIDEADGYANAVAAGLFSPGHAPPETIRHALAALRPGGVFVFSLNDHAIADRCYQARINDLVDGGAAEVVFKEYGPHLPARDLKAMIYGLKKR